MNKEPMVSIEEISTEFRFLDVYIAVLVQAGFVIGKSAENIEDYMIDRASFETWFEARKNGWRLPSPPELAQIIEDRKNTGMINDI